MTVRDEIAQARREMGARRREGPGVLEQYVEGPSGEPARLTAKKGRQACRSSDCAIAVEAFMNNAG